MNRRACQDVVDQFGIIWSERTNLQQFNQITTLWKEGNGYFQRDVGNDPVRRIDINNLPHAMQAGRPYNSIQEFNKSRYS